MKLCLESLITQDLENSKRFCECCFGKKPLKITTRTNVFLQSEVKYIPFIKILEQKRSNKNLKLLNLIFVILKPVGLATLYFLGTNRTYDRTLGRLSANISLLYTHLILYVFKKLNNMNLARSLVNFIGERIMLYNSVKVKLNFIWYHGAYLHIVYICFNDLSI